MFRLVFAGKIHLPGRKKEVFMAGILGKKVGMTQIFQDGNVVPVTVLQAGPCVVVQKKTVETDGYTAVQVGFVDKKLKQVTKPEAGHFKKANSAPKSHLAEFRAEDMFKLDVGQAITVEVFKEGDYVSVTGLSKGKGFQGGVKRHGFKGGPGSHGSMFHRAVGGIGGRVRVRGHIWKGRRMPGHDGQETITAPNLKVVLVDKDENVILVRGAVPGSNGTIVRINIAKKNEKLVLRDTRYKKEQDKLLAALQAKEKAEKEKKKAPAKTGGKK